MSSYAKGTEVSTSRSREEIESTLSRYGADAFMYAWDGPRAILAFRMRDRQIKFTLPMPSRDDEQIKFRRHSSGKLLPRSEADAHKAWDQACRERWRALALVIKAKLEAVASGITVFEDEFLAQTMMPDGRTVSEHTRPAIEKAYKTGKVQALLPPP